VNARNLVSPHPTVAVDAPASEAAALLSRHDVRAVLVVRSDGALAGVLSDSTLLRYLLPSYVEEDSALAGVLEEAAADVLWQRLKGRRVGDLLPDDQKDVPVVDADDTLVEVASVMVRTSSPLAGVREDDQIVGAITLNHLLAHLLQRR
jgi:CBS domain-containing protein